jgi:hypothetical protein
MGVHPLKLSNEGMRSTAHTWVDKAPLGMLIKFQEPTRSLDQNAKLWAMLEDIARGKEHNGKHHSKEVWKALFMSACGHELELIPGLNGEAVSMGNSSSKLSVAMMSELIEFISFWAAENGVAFRERGFT